VLFWAVVSDSTEEAVELFPTREEAEAIVQRGIATSPSRLALCASRGSSSGRGRRTSGTGLERSCETLVAWAKEA
jgi:hypothetical protein